MQTVTIEFTAEHKYKPGLVFIPGTRLVMHSGAAQHFLSRGLAKVVTASKPKAKPKAKAKDGDSLDG